MKKCLLTSLLLILMVPIGLAQSLRVKIIASATGEPVPYANISVNAIENLVSNGEGYFSLSENNSQDATVVLVSYLGFVNQQITVEQIKKQDLTIRMLPAMYELEDVAISNEKITADQIMATVKANLKTNYQTSEKANKDKIFHRTTQYFDPSKIEVEINKSTGFSKVALDKVNNDIQSYARKLIAHPPVSFTDVLCNYYSVKTKKSDKFVFTSKLDVLKATILKNEGQSTSLEDLEKKGKELMLKHLDTTKFYRFKSGLIGSRDTISFSEEFNRKLNKDTVNTKQLAQAKSD
ncbi:MAG: carboxypeptidase-like regulatory domain-containing protein, partial [Bacteroidetes bacterium]|nr:carboxypeptidase-like regulatory domain-containing protein [Bacteroidota bacterium]